MGNYRRYDPLVEMIKRQGRHAKGAGMLKQELREEILARLAEVQGAHTLGDKKIGGLIGVSGAVINLIKNEAYTGDTDKYLILIKGWLDNRDLDNKLPDAKYIPTEVGEKIRMVCTMAVQKPCLGLIKTPSGWGKTAALQEVARQVGKRCCYIQAGEANSYKRDLLYTLAQALGVPNLDSAARLYSEIRRKLASFYGGGMARPFLVLMDEATTLKSSTLNLLRNLHDDRSCRTAIVFADTVSRFDNFLYGRSAIAIAGGNEQFRSRAKAQCIVDGTEAIKAGDVQAVAQAAAKAAGHCKKLDAGAVKYLVALAANPGALRNVVSRIENVAFFATEKKLPAEYTAAQLDYVGTLSGDEWTMKHTTMPFGNGAVQAAKVADKRKRA